MIDKHIGTYHVHTLKNGTQSFKKQLKLGVEAMTGKEVITTVSARNLEELRLKVARKKHEFSSSAPTPTFGELANLWLGSYLPTVKPNTQKSVKGMVNRYYLPIWEHTPIDQITTPDIQAIINHWGTLAKEPLTTKYREPGKGKTIGRRIACLKTIFQFAKEQQLLTVDPTLNLHSPRPQKSASYQKVTHLTKDQVSVLLKGLKEPPDQTMRLPFSYRQELVKAFMYLLLFSGLRAGEALALGWGDLDPKTAKLTVSKTMDCHNEISDSPKTKKSYRTISLDRETLNVLNKWRLYQAEDFLGMGQPQPVHMFSDRGKQKPVQHIGLGVTAKKVYERCGLPDVRFHGLRHTHAALLLNSGTPGKEIQERLGHEKLAVTMNAYGHLYETSQSQLLDSLTRFLGR